MATYFQRRHPNLRGFTRASLFRIRQFFETYRNGKKVAALLRQLKWTHHLMILGRCKLADERPSIGVLLCATRDTEVVEYALALSASPALIAEYKTRLPDVALLKGKLHEFYQLALPHAAPASHKRRKSPEPRAPLPRSLSDTTACCTATAQFVGGFSAQARGLPEGSRGSQPGEDPRVAVPNLPSTPEGSQIPGIPSG